jgi:glycosyltransferase involved in cell wall biosynthesis
MINALASLGHDVHLAVLGEAGSIPADKHKGWSVSALREQSDRRLPERNGDRPYRRIANRWMQYWGIPAWVPTSIHLLIEEFQPDTAIVNGLQALPLAALIQNVPAVWYAADDWVLHHLTLAREGPFRGRVQSLRNAALCLFYERSLSYRVAGAIAVSKKDQRALRNFGGFRQVALIQDGVDSEFFQPRPEKESEKPSLCFWGRMDFEPNIDAMLWFCGEIWPLLFEEFPEAEMTIVGISPTPEIRKLGLNSSIRVTGEVEDVRPFAWDSQVVVMPFRTGAGIKTKLLEACAMGKPIVTSQTAIAGLNIRNESPEPWIVAHDKEDWVTAIKVLWTNWEKRQRLGRSARDYVVTNHSWRKAADMFVDFMRTMK